MQNLWNWISQISPDTVVTIAVAVLTIGYHLIRRDSKQSLLAQLEDLGKQVVHALVTDPNITSATSLDQLKSMARAELVSLVKKAGIPDNAITEVLIARFVDQAVAAALAEMRTIDTGTTTAAPAAPATGTTMTTAEGAIPKARSHYRVSKAVAAATMIAFLFGAPLMQGCKPGQVQTWTGAFAGCEKADLGQQVTVENITTGLLTAIGYIVQGNFPTLENDLAQLAAVVGFGAVRCAILAFEAAIAQPSSGSATPQVVPPGLARMKAWLGKQEAAATTKGSAP